MAIARALVTGPSVLLARPWIVAVPGGVRARDVDAAETMRASPRRPAGSRCELGRNGVAPAVHTAGRRPRRSVGW